MRIDSAVYHGYTIPPFYNSLVGKLIVHGKTRSECLMRLQARARRIRGRWHRDDVAAVSRAGARNEIIDGDYHIHWLEEFLARGSLEQ